MAFLVLNDSNERFIIPRGQTVLGRGPYFRVKELSLSRSHALLSFHDGKLSIKPTNKNPTYFYSSVDDEQQVQLERDEWKDLVDGDQISLMGDSYKYKIEICGSIELNGDSLGNIDDKHPLSGNEDYSHELEMPNDGCLDNEEIKEESSDIENLCLVSSTLEKENLVVNQLPISTLSQYDLQPCPYGIRCYRKNPLHFKEYSHNFTNHRKQSFNQKLSGQGRSHALKREDNLKNKPKKHYNRTNNVNNGNSSRDNLIDGFCSKSNRNERLGCDRSNSSYSRSSSCKINNKDNIKGQDMRNNNNVLHNNYVDSCSNNCKISNSNNNNSCVDNDNISTKNHNNSESNSSNESINNNNNNISNSTKTTGQRMNGGIRSGSAADVHCDCNSVAALRTTVKEGPNTGRQFYCCMKPRGKQCKFFQWADQGNNSTTGIDKCPGSGVKRKHEAIETGSLIQGWELVHKTQRNSPNSTFYYNRNISKPTHPASAKE